MINQQKEGLITVMLMHVLLHFEMLINTIAWNYCIKLLSKFYLKLFVLAIATPSMDFY